MNSVDLRDCLQSWPYDEQSSVRIRRGADGREIILVRRPMGIEQYEADGRPDGRRVQGGESVLDFHLARMSTALASPFGDCYRTRRGRLCGAFQRSLRIL